jgi:hypothetical protein
MKTLTVIIATMIATVLHADDDLVSKFSGPRDTTGLLNHGPDQNILATYEKAYWPCGRLLTPTPTNSSIDHFAYTRCVDLRDIMLRRPRDPWVAADGHRARSPNLPSMAELPAPAIRGALIIRC